MLSSAQIEKMVANRSWRRLIDRVLENGRCAAAREHLIHPGVCEAAGCGLALQRLAELAYAPSETINKLIRRVLGWVDADGLVGCASGVALADGRVEPVPQDCRLSASAAVLSGLMAASNLARCDRTASTAPETMRRDMIRLIAEALVDRLTALDLNAEFETLNVSMVLLADHHKALLEVQGFSTLLEVWRVMCSTNGRTELSRYARAVAA